MSEIDNKVETPRRGFLKLAGFGAVGGAAAAALTSGAANAAEADPADGSGYAETEHVRTYYDLARF